MMHFTVEEENLICMYHNADRRRTIGKITAAMPGMDGDMWTLASGVFSFCVCPAKLDHTSRCKSGHGNRQ